MFNGTPKAARYHVCEARPRLYFGDNGDNGDEFDVSDKLFNVSL